MLSSDIVLLQAGAKNRIHQELKGLGLRPNKLWLVVSEQLSRSGGSGTVVGDATRAYSLAGHAWSALGVGRPFAGNSES